MKLSKQMFVMVALAMVMIISGCEIGAEKWNDPLPGPAVFDFDAADAVADFPGLLDGFDEADLVVVNDNTRAFDVDATTRVYFFDINLHNLGGYNTEAIADTFPNNQLIASLGYVVTNSYENTLVVTLVSDEDVAFTSSLKSTIDWIVTSMIDQWHFQ